jgi:hypothetical protein
MRRRKLLIGAGSLIAGSAAAVGTGAFTTATIPDRSVAVSVSDDDDSQIALVPGNDPDISITDDGVLSMDLSGADGEGVNINSRYTWGDPTDPANDYAFKIVNNDEGTNDDGSNRDYGPLTASYEFADDSWLEQNADQSFIQFQVFEPSPKNIQLDAPAQNFGGGFDGVTNISSDGTYEDTSGNRSLDADEEWYVVVTVDTTGDDASTDDALAGGLTLSLDLDED